MHRMRLAFIAMISVTLLGALFLLHVQAVGRGKQPAGAGTQGAPVLVELFTSEGCSDCPPADALLEKLDRTQPARGAEVIVLSEHVDYWNGIGWRDPYSSHEYSVRQSAFATQLGLRSIYTPQMVVDGSIEFVGSDERRAIQAIEIAAKTEKVPISLSQMRFEANKILALHVETGALPPAAEGESGNVLVAVADESDESHVSRGENAGRTLRHVAVLRTLAVVGTVDKTAGFSDSVTIDLPSANSRNVRLIAFVEEKAGGRIWGVQSARLPK